LSNPLPSLLAQADFETVDAAEAKLLREDLAPSLEILRRLDAILAALADRPCRT
jgi:hypothetical protein